MSDHETFDPSASGDPFNATASSVSSGDAASAAAAGAIPSPEAASFASYFNDSSFWKKTRRYAQAAGRQLIELALMAYYTATAPSTPTWAKTIIFAALGYFIMPVDAIPDMIPGAGYSDDLGILVAAISTIGAHVTDEIRAKARAKLTEWFPLAA